MRSVVYVIIHGMEVFWYDLCHAFWEPVRSTQDCSCVGFIIWDAIFPYDIMI